MFFNLTHWQNATGKADPDTRPDILIQLDSEVKQLSDRLSIYDRVDIAFKVYNQCVVLATANLTENQINAVIILRNNCLNCLKAVFQVAEDEDERVVLNRMKIRTTHKHKDPFYLPGVQRSGLPNPSSFPNQKKYLLKKALVQINFFRKKENLPMLEKFNSEKEAKDHQGVVYFGDEVEQYRLLIHKGCLYHFKQVMTDSNVVETQFVPFETNNKSWLFIMDTKGNMYSCPDEPHLKEKINHSSLSNGGWVKMAGMIQANQGRVMKLLRLSGHYQPTQDQFAHVVQELRAQKLNLQHTDFDDSVMDKMQLAIRYGVPIVEEKKELPSVNVVPPEKDELKIPVEDTSPRFLPFASEVNEETQRLLPAIKWNSNPLEFKSLSEDILRQITTATNAAWFGCTPNCTLLSAGLLYNLKVGQAQFGFDNVFPIYKPISLSTAHNLIFGKNLQFENTTIGELPRSLIKIHRETGETIFSLAVDYNFILFGHSLGHCFNAAIINENNTTTILFADAWKRSVYNTEKLDNTYGSNNPCGIFWHAGPVRQIIKRVEPALNLSL